MCPAGAEEDAAGCITRENTFQSRPTGVSYQQGRHSPRNFDTVFTGPLLEWRLGDEEDAPMDVLMIVLAAGFFLLSVWLISALNRL
jgi:hypothetical protein